MNEEEQEDKPPLAQRYFFLPEQNRHIRLTHLVELDPGVHSASRINGTWYFQQYKKDLMRLNEDEFSDDDLLDLGKFSPELLEYYSRPDYFKNGTKHEATVKQAITKDGQMYV